MKHPHSTHKQKAFIQEYVSTGDAVESARTAEYSDRSLPSLHTEASRLKRRLSSQIAKSFSIKSSTRLLRLWENIKT